MSKKVAAAVKRGLEAEGFAVDTAPDGREGKYLATESAFNALTKRCSINGATGSSCSTPHKYYRGSRIVRRMQHADAGSM